jgi:DNA-binding transcriptional ArsR family regulator
MSDPLTAVFAALADPTRRGLLEDLTRTPAGATATELAHARPVTRQAVVRHLQVLVRSGLAQTHRAGREVLYVAAPSAAEPASRWIERRITAWERRLDTLAARLTVPRP